MTAAVAAGALVLAALCFRMAQLHRKLADLNQLVADMLRSPDLAAAERLAAAFADEHGIGRRRRGR